MFELEIFFKVNGFRYIQHFNPTLKVRGSMNCMKGVRGQWTILLTHAGRNRCTTNIEFVGDGHNFSPLIDQVHTNCVDDFVIQTTYFSRIILLPRSVFDDVAVPTPTEKRKG